MTLITDASRPERKSRRVPEMAVTTVPEPEFTKTWHPISHGRFIYAVQEAIKEYGMAVVDKQYSLTRDGKDMFGTWTIEKISEQDEGIRWALGLRNSMKKTFAVGICAGNKVVVCDNLVFHGDFIEFRKHTSGLNDEELLIIAKKSLDGLVIRMETLTQWHTKLKEFHIEEQDFKALTFDIMKAGAVPPSKFTNLLQAYDEENHVVNGNKETMYAFHGAVTRVFRGMSLFDISTRSKILTDSIDDYLELKSIEEGQPGIFKRLSERIKMLL